MVKTPCGVELHGAHRRRRGRGTVIFFLKKKLSMLMVLSKIKNYMNEIFYTSNVTNRCLKILLVCCLAMSDILLQNLPANDLDQQLFKKILHAIRLVRST